MNNTMCRIAVVSLLVPTLLMTSAAWAGDDDDPLQVVRIGLQRAYGSVKTFKGTVVKSNVEYAQGKTVRRAKIVGASDGQRGRISYIDLQAPVLEFEGLFDGANSTTWVKKGLNAKPMASITKGMSGSAGSNLANALSPLEHGIWRIPDGMEVTVSGREVHDGTDCIVLQIGPYDMPVNAQCTCRVWVCPDKGFSVPKIDSTYTAKGTGALLRREEDVTVLREYGSGVWGPGRYTASIYGKDGQMISQIILDYGVDFQINGPIVQDEVEMPLPSGLEVFDGVLLMQYTVP